MLAARAGANVRRFGGVAAIAAAGIALSLTMFLVLRANEADRVDTRIDRALTVHVAALEREVARNLSAVRSVAAHYGAADTVSREQFRAFVADTLTRSPSIQALEWIPRVGESERERFEQWARADGLAGFEFTERDAAGEVVSASGRDEFFPVYFVEPLAGNEAALGFDLSSNPTRQAALVAARDSGELVASGRITLVQEKDQRHGFLAFFPAYAIGASPSTVDNRQRDLEGFALGVFRVPDLVEAATAGLTGLDLRLVDSAAEPDAQLLYDSTADTAATTETQPVESSSASPHQAGIDVGGRQWLVVASPTAELAGGTPWQSWGALWLGLLLTTSLCGAAFRRRTEAARTHRIVEEQTGELAAARARMQALIAASPIAIMELDLEGKVALWNPAAERIYGYTEHEAIGRPFKAAPPDKMDEVEETRARIARGESFADLETVRRRKDGSLVDVAISAAPVRDNGDVVSHIGLVTDITDRKRAEHQLLAKTEELETAYDDLENTRREQLRVKDEFLSHVSHELRTPLAAAHQFVSLVCDRAAGEVNEDQDECLVVAVRNLRQLRVMIDDLLDATRADSGQLSAQREQTSLQAVTGEIISSHTQIAASKDTVLTFDIPEDLPPVYGDPARLRQIVTNLVDNAIKFTPERGTVDVRAALSDDDPNMLQVDVIDTGQGVPSESLERIFERHHQEQSEEGTTRQGLGLGLYICRKLIELQGGRIWASSTLDEGSVFSFTIPLYSLASVLPLAVANETQHDVALVTIELISADGSPLDLGRCTLARDQVGEQIAKCLRPDEDGLLPPTADADGERFLFVAAATDLDGAETLAERIRTQIERHTDLKNLGVSSIVDAEAIRLDASSPPEGRLTELGSQIDRAVSNRIRS